MTSSLMRYYDPDIDTLWLISERGRESRYEEPFPGVRIEFGGNNQIIGVELENFSRMFKIRATSKGIGDKYTFFLQRGGDPLFNFDYRISAGK